MRDYIPLRDLPSFQTNVFLGYGGLLVGLWFMYPLYLIYVMHVMCVIVRMYARNRMFTALVYGSHSTGPVARATAHAALSLGSPSSTGRLYVK